MKTTDKEIKDFLKALSRLINQYKDIFENSEGLQLDTYPRKSSRIEGERLKNKIIGGLPKLLLSKRYFPTNLDIDRFAKSYLYLNIPYAGKKSREELIGRVVSRIAKLQRDELETFNRVLNEVLVKADTGKLSNFFLEWEKAINELKVR